MRSTRTFARTIITLLATLALVASLTAGGALAQAAACTVDYTNSSQWPGGFTANVTITNTGTTDVNGWTLAWQFPDGQQIAQAWNATVTSAGPAASVSNAAWNTGIPAGGTTGLGFNGTWQGANGAPTSFTLNGTTCGDDPGAPTEQPTDPPTEEPTDPPTDEPTDEPTEEPTQDTTLRTAAGAAGIDIGVATAVDLLASDPAYREVIARDFSSVTPGNAMKWASVEPTQGQYTWGDADSLVDFARANGQVVRGHTLVWHNQNPSWLATGGFSDAEVRDLLQRHITDEVTHFRGEIVHWDVVNEAFNEDGTWRDTRWYRAMGPDYIADALSWAHAADPGAKLYLNDYNIDGLGAKSDAYYTLAQQLLADGVPLDGIGLQGHLQTTWFPSEVRENIQRFADLGLDVAFTEVDIRMPMPVTDEKLATQADHFARTVDACLAVPRCVSYTVWGTDRDSWVPDWFEGEGAATLHDEDYQPKPAYHAVVDTLLAHAQ